MIKILPDKTILDQIAEIERLREQCGAVKLPVSLSLALRKNSRKKSSYASNRIEGNPLTEAEASEAIESSKRHYLANAASDLTPALTHLSFKERRFFDYLIRKKIDEFTPIEMAKMMKVTNRTIINWSVALAKNGLLEPQLVQKRIRSYRVAQRPGC